MLKEEGTELYNKLKPEIIDLTKGFKARGTHHKLAVKWQSSVPMPQRAAHQDAARV